MFLFLFVDFLSLVEGLFNMKKEQSEYLRFTLSFILLIHIFLAE